MTWIGLVFIAVGLCLRTWALHCLKLAGISNKFLLSVPAVPNHWTEDGPYAWMKHPAYVGSWLTLYGLGLICLGTLGGGFAVLIPTIPYYFGRIAEENQLRSNIKGRVDLTKDEVG